MSITNILACAIIFQIATAIFAVRLIRITGKSTAWILILIALAFLIVWHAIQLYNVLPGNVSASLDPTNEFIDLILSFLMMIGVAKIAPIFFAVKKSELELKKSETRFSEIFKSSPIAITLNRLSDGSYVDVNESFLYLVGFAREEVIGKTALELGIHLDREKNKELFQILRENKCIQDYEMLLGAKSGNVIETLTSFENILLDDEKYVITSIIDITKQKKMDSKIQRLSSLYATINQIDHAIVGARRPEEIFQKTCDAAIQYGGFYMTWIGSLNEKTGKVNPVAHAGNEDGYLKDIDISDRLIPVGRGPTGTALRDEKSVICEDIESDPRMEPWRSRATKHGLRSSASIPIRLRGNVAYVLILYAKEPCFFTSDQLQLLEEIGTHISFALDTLELETERNRAEEILRKSEELYRITFENTGTAIILIEEDKTISMVNTEFERLSGYSKSEIEGKIKWTEFVAKDDYDRMAAFHRLRREDSGKVPKQYEFCFVDRSGTIHSILIYVDIIKGIKTSIASLLDITERKQAEEAQRESELRYRSVLQSATDAIVTADGNGIIIGWNRAAERIFGYNYTEAAGQPLTSIVPPFHRTAHSNGLKKVLSVEEQQITGKTIETEGLRKDKSVFPIELSLSTWVTNSEQYFTGIIRDITERKQMEEELRQMQKLEGLGTLAGGISHDFNNILGIILGYISSLKNYKNNTNKIDLAIETITKAVDRGKTLVQQILTFARKTKPAFGAVNVNNIVREIMVMVIETFPKVLTYSQTLDEAIPSINADHSQLHQALLNLCVNARDAMPNGGLLTINTHMVSGVNLRNQHPDATGSDYICIEVIDTGEGMTEETRKHIFEPFYTTKEFGKGTGLGLSVVFGIIQTHKGFIDVESEIGKGTTFKLYLPTSLTIEPVIKEEDGKTLEEIPGGKETILIVEDEEMLMMSLQMALEQKGYNILSATDGLQALKIFQERKKDIALVMTDLGLPTMTGLEVCQRIKKIESNKQMILATGFLDADTKSEFLEAGIRHFLYKPYDIKKVLKMIREVLDKK